MTEADFWEINFLLLLIRLQAERMMLKDSRDADLGGEA
jgi:hypothetical protein